MANNRCDNNCENRRRRGCMRMARGCWGNFPYYGGPCPDTCGCYGYSRCDSDDDDDNDNNCGCGPNGNGGGRRRRRRRRRGNGPENAVFTAFPPQAVSANGLIPLALNNPCRDAMFEVNSGLITLESEGAYLAMVSVRTPEDIALDTTITLNVNDASQTPAIMRVVADGTGTTSYEAETIFEADEGDTVSLRTAEAISVTDTSTQPMFTLTLLKLDS